ncbi:MAG: MATE family efflux transporter [Caulobacteraceae bacterium]
MTLPARPIARIAGLAAPLILFFLIQNLAGLGVLAIVGRLGAPEVAALGLASTLNGLLAALLSGFDTAAQALISRATGAGRREEAVAALRSSLTLSAPLGLVLAALAATAGPAVVAALNPDAASAALAGENLRAGALSLALMGLTIPVNAYWIATGQPRTAFAVACAIVPVQILFTLLLAPRYGLVGAGWAFSAACGVALAVQAALAARRVPELFTDPGLERGAGWIVSIAWPVSLQQALAQFALMVAYGIAAQLGVAQTAVLSVIANVTSLPIQTATGFGIAAATLVGHALGRESAAEARRWGWQVAAAASAVLAPVSLASLIVPDAVLALFLNDPAIVEMAVLPARIIGAGVCIDAFGRVLSFALRGAGATKLAAGVPFALHWVIQLPLMALVALQWRYGVTGMVVTEVGLAALESVVLALVWTTGFWAPRTAPPPSLDGDFHRIVVMGGAGAGKSTLARALGAAHGLEVIHMDRLVFGPKWRRRPDAEVIEDLRNLLGRDRWIVEGVYPFIWPLTLPQADLVIWIEQPSLTRLWRAWRKTRIHRGRERADRPDGCEEGFSLRYAWDILKFGTFTKRLEAGLKSAAPQALVLALRGDREVAAIALQERTSYPETLSLKPLTIG